MLHTILLVDDDHEFCTSLQQYLQKFDFLVLISHSPTEAIDYLNQNFFDLVLLDHGFAQGNGLEVIRYMNNSAVNTMVLMFSGNHDSQTRVQALKIGADDFLLKPFDPNELVLRMNKLLCRRFGTRNAHLKTRYFTLNLLTGQIIAPKKILLLRRKELYILAYLIQHKNNIVTKEQLIENMWSIEDMPQRDTIDVHIRRIRLRIGDKKKLIIKTVYGRGYMFFEPLEEVTFSQKQSVRSRSLHDSAGRTYETDH